MSSQSYPKTVEHLAKLVADTYGLLLKTQNYHWNVKGPQFYSLHNMLEEQYQNLFEAADEIAERLRALDEIAPGTYAEFAQLTVIPEGKASLSAYDMVEDLKNSHELIIKNLEVAIDEASGENDPVTEDLFIARKSYHDKTRWMLKASLEGWK